MKILITGSLGLIGFTTTEYFLEKGHRVVGVDNDMRSVFFGRDGSNKVKRNFLIRNKNYSHNWIDIRDKKRMERLIKGNSFGAIIHSAGQPSHDKASQIPLEDFEVNTLGTVYILDAIRKYSQKSTMVFTSTNKVYGDNPNKVKLVEKAKRYDFADKKLKGFIEATSIDNCLHSLMGASNLAADIYVQEYGKYYNLNTTTIRLGCVTGKYHNGVKLHGFLSFLVKSLINNNSYEIIGYKGKQVRDQIHAIDVARAFEQIIKRPVRGEVFNLGGGRKNSASILELIEIISRKLQAKPKVIIKKKARLGDHICYISDYSKFRKFYPKWRISMNLDTIINELIEYEHTRHS